MALTIDDEIQTLQASDVSSIQRQFQSEYDAEVAALLQRRFRWWVGTWLIIWLLWLPAFTAQTMMCMGVIAAGGWVGSRRLLSIEERIRTAFWMLVITAALSVGLSGFGVIAGPFFAFFLWSGISLLVASFFLPMTLAQTARPAVVILIMWVVTAIWADKLQIQWVSPLIVIQHAFVFIPALLVTGFRASRFGKHFESRMLRRHQEDFTREVFDAQKLHAALFPPERLTGVIQFRYVDLPRAGIGGDFLHAEFDARGRLNLVVLDVSGDGISAALTVHRLHGELERVMAESADDSMMPDDALAKLDHYVKLTLAPHGIYGFALFFRISTEGLVEWSGAGHTPAFIRRADGSTERLECTTWPLGASSDPDPLQCLNKTQLRLGDVLLIHTDGACEERNALDQRLGYAGTYEMVRNAENPANPLDWPEHFITLLEDFRGTGESMQNVRREDTLVACITLNHKTPMPDGPSENPANLTEEMVNHP